ncbi:hypothetical protein SASPL_136111 [Salvia splendens]|uniref:Uncharacterized protein n=1 Tax=Salvia splendens TaxID=180675 RepID=A0A8X8ZGC4_SALSN|nr:hypothetical protein SASPL_136111 [Salvia splendens]
MDSRRCQTCYSKQSRNSHQDKNLNRKPQAPAIQVLLHRADHATTEIYAGEAEISLQSRLAALGLHNWRLVEIREGNVKDGGIKREVYLIHTIEST